MNNEQLIHSLHQIDQEYPYWESFKHKITSYENLKSYKPAELWETMTLFRKYQFIGGIKFTSLKYSLTNKISHQLHKFDLDLGGSIQSDVIIPDEHKERYFISSIMEEAIASSQLEGAVTTRRLAKEMLRTNRKPKNHSEKMILNNYLTIKKVVDQKNQKLTPEFIKEIQAIVTKGTLEKPENEGEFRESNDVKVVDGITGEVFYDPPAFDEVEKLIKDLCDFINKKEDDPFIHPIIKGIILHFMIGYIHPFVDGNGRTARALYYWYLVRKGYWIVEYLSISRIILKSPAQYSRAYLYTEYDENDLTYFIDYNLKCMSQALEEFKKYVKRKIKEKKEAFELMKSEDVNERQAQILNIFHNEPDKVLTIKEVENLFSVVYQTARTDLMDLETKKYLKSKTSGKKLIFYKA
ncbi:Fic family protein [Ekhidna lutea]|nr:Fic family protein [Ekhidna lutea]